MSGRAWRTLIGALALCAWLSTPAQAQLPGGSDIQINLTPVIGGTSGNCFYINGAVVGQQACGAGTAADIKVGTTTVSSGTTLQVLYNNAGVLGNYTNTQLTALINAATASLSGALPAWPNNTTTFFRGDGSYAAVTSAALNITTTTCTNQFVSAISAGGVGTCSSPTAAEIPLTNTHILVGNASNVAVDVALSGDATMANTGAMTLASVVSAGGPTGSATVAPIITYDAKGRLTTVSSATITPAVGSITGLGTGVATALGINVGSAGAFVTFNGALGTPSSGTGTNITNVNAATLGGATFAAPGAIGGGTASTGAFTTVTLTSVNKVAITAPATSATITIADGTTLTQTTSTSVGKGQYLATATNDTATTGNIGECISSTIAFGSAVSLSSGVAADVTTISVTAGQWQINGIVYYTLGATTSVTLLSASVGTTTALGSTAGQFAAATFPSTVIGNTYYYSIESPPQTIRLSGTTTYHLVAQGNFSVSTLSAWGTVEACRVR